MYSFPPFEKLWNVVSPPRTQSRTTSPQNVLYWFLQKVCTYLRIRGIVRTLCRNLYLLLRDKRDGVRVCVICTYAYRALLYVVRYSLLWSCHRNSEQNLRTALALYKRTHICRHSTHGGTILRRSKPAGRCTVHTVVIKNTETYRRVTWTTYSLLY